MKIILLGYIVRGPVGGLVWHHFQYALGLKLLGYDVLFLEQCGNYPSCYNPVSHEFSTDPSFGLEFINSIFSKHGLKHQWAYFDEHSNQWHGKTKQEVITFSKDADILLNLSGINQLNDIFLNIPIKAFIDTDPLFTQIRLLNDPAMNQNAKEHNAFFSFGENIGNEDCIIPSHQYNWVPTRQPVIPGLWNQSKEITSKANWTTVMQWESYENVEWNGKVFGMKSDSFQGFLNTPKIFKEQFELALGGSTAPTEKLKTYGWNIINPTEVTLTPESYQMYISQSKGEWSVAKEGYVSSNSGWFSERSAAYLMSGKPVVVQETGFSKFIKSGKGLFSFKSPLELESIFNEINLDYNSQSKHAREIAMEYFHFEKVLKHLLEKI